MNREEPTTDQTESPGQQPAPPRKRPSTLLRILLPLLVLGAAAGAAVWMLQTSPKAKPRPKARNAALVEVRAVEFGPQRTVVAAMGTVLSSREVELRPQVAGAVVAVSDDLVPGGRFGEGQALLRIDPTDYELAVRQLESELARAEAELQLEQGNQLVAQKEFELLGEAVSDEERALMLRRPQLLSLRAAYEGARARLEQARVDLHRTVVAAPFNAAVASREVHLGTRVSQSTALATLVGTDAFWVEVSVPVSQLRWFAIPAADSENGSPVRIYDRAAWGEGVFRRGRVIRLAAALEEEGRMARLLVEVDDPLALRAENVGEPPMLIDAYVQVEIEGRELPAAAAVDRAWLRDGQVLWVMNGEDQLEIRPVEIAFRGREQVLVTGGLAPGERVVVSDLPAPVAGMALRLADEPAPAATDGQQQ